MNLTQKTNHAQIEYDFVDLKNYNFSTQQVVFSNHLIEQLHLKKLTNKSSETFSILDVLSRLSGYGFVMTKNFASIEFFKQIHSIKDQLAIKNIKLSIDELNKIQIDVFNYIVVDGKKRNKKIKQTVKLFNDLRIINTDHGKGIIYEFNHIATQLIDNRMGAKEYFKLYAEKHSLTHDEYNYYLTKLSDDLYKICSIDYGFTVDEVNYFTALKPDQLLIEIETSSIIANRFNSVDSNAIHLSSAQYKNFSKILLGTTQCFECLHTNQLQSYILTKLSLNKERYINGLGKKYLIENVSALELREALGFELPKYDDNYELTLAINKLIVDLNKYSQHNVSITRLEKKGNRGLSAQFELTVTEKDSDELKLLKDTFRIKNKKGSIVPSEFQLQRNFTFKNLYKVTSNGKVEILSKSLFIKHAVKKDEKLAAKPSNLFAASQDKYSQAHTDPHQRMHTNTKSKNSTDAKEVNDTLLDEQLECITTETDILLKSRYKQQIKEITVTCCGFTETYDFTDNLLDQKSTDFKLSKNIFKEFKNKRILLRRSKDQHLFNITAKFSDEKTATTKLLI